MCLMMNLKWKIIRVNRHNKKKSSKMIPSINNDGLFPLFQYRENISTIMKFLHFYFLWLKLIKCHNNRIFVFDVKNIKWLESDPSFLFIIWFYFWIEWIFFKTNYSLDALKKNYIYLLFNKLTKNVMKASHYTTAYLNCTKYWKFSIEILVGNFQETEFIWYTTNKYLLIFMSPAVIFGELLVKHLAVS